MRAARKLQPWEATTKCPRCGAGPGQRCRTVTTRYGPESKPVRDGRLPGTPTVAHLGRVELHLARDAAAALRDLLLRGPM